MASSLNEEKHQLHELIEKLPVEHVPAASRFLHYLCADPVLRPKNQSSLCRQLQGIHGIHVRLLSLLTAPPDDEPYTQQQREQDADAEASIARGEGVSHDELLREFRVSR